MKFIKVYRRNPGDGRIVPKEQSFNQIKFYKHKFNNRECPQDKRKILIITCFSEFGCESLAIMYCIPKIIQKNPGAYVICVGWYGREYLYRHLVDEYWEMEEQFQWLREYSQAFHNTSKNLFSLEESLQDYGQVYRGLLMGHICLGNTCFDCGHFWGNEDENAKCEKCNSSNIDRSLLANIPYHKKFAVQIPRPSIKMQTIAKKYLGTNPVGIFARGRVCYGRNLTPEFYIKLIENLREKGYTPIWLGEKQSVLPCPVSNVLDFSRLPEARNLELTLAIISQLKFTVQFWTASTRFASMMDVPWILFESPDQIAGMGQEGKRIALTTDSNKKKLVLAQYQSVMENEERALELVEQAIQEMNENNWDDIVGMVEYPEFIKIMISKQNYWK